MVGLPLDRSKKALHRRIVARAPATDPSVDTPRHPVQASQPLLHPAIPYHDEFPVLRIAPGRSLLCEFDQAEYQFVVDLLVGQTADRPLCGHRLFERHGKWIPGSLRIGLGHGSLLVGKTEARVPSQRTPHTDAGHPSRRGPRTDQYRIRQRAGAGDSGGDVDHRSNSPPRPEIIEPRIDLRKWASRSDERLQIQASAPPERDVTGDVAKGIRSSQHGRENLLAGDHESRGQHRIGLIEGGSPYADERATIAQAHQPRIDETGSSGRLENVVEAYAGDLHRPAREILGRRVDEVGCAQRTRPLPSFGEGIGNHDARGSGQARSLNHREPDAAQTKDENGGSLLYPGRIEDSADARLYRAAENTGNVERDIGRNLDGGTRRADEVLGEGRDVEAPIDDLAGAGEPGRTVGEGVRGEPDGIDAQRGVAAHAEVAHSAGRTGREHYMISDREAVDPSPDLLDDPGGLVPEYDRQSCGKGPVDHTQVRVTEAAMADPDPHLPRRWIANLQVIANHDSLALLLEYRCLHRSPTPFPDSPGSRTFYAHESAAPATAAISLPPPGDRSLPGHGKHTQRRRDSLGIAMQPRLSLIIPAFDERDRLPPALMRMADALADFTREAEIIVVDDGSRDATAEVAAGVAAAVPIRVVSLASNRGKGAAVARGVAEARFDCIAFTDADAPYDPAILPAMVACVEEGRAEIAIGARDLPGSEIERGYGPLRFASGQIFSWITRSLIGLPFPDSQCGLKVFRGDVARRLFALRSIDGFGFDVEILAAALARGHRIERFPVRLTHDVDSRINLVADSLAMLQEVLRVRRRLRAGLYADFDPTVSDGDCPLCGGGKFEPRTVAAGYRMVECAECGLWHLNPAPTESELASIYDERYFSSAHSGTSGYADYEAAAEDLRDTFDRRLDLVRPERGRGRILDVGAGYGLLLDAARKDFPERWALEPSPAATRRIADDHRTVCGDLTSPELPLAHFDVVSLQDCFEHLLDPVQTLARIRLLLRPGGYLILTTPDVDSWLHRVQGPNWISFKFPEHVILYSGSTLRRALETAGFRIEHLESAGLYTKLDLLVTKIFARRPEAARRAKRLLARIGAGQRRIWVPSGSLTVVARAEA